MITTRDEEIRRRDVIISQLTERIPAIEAPQEPREPPETVEEEPEGAETAPMPQALRRLYGGRGGGGCSVADREEAEMCEVARRLLRALVNEALSRRPTEETEDVVGSPVVVTAATAAAAKIPTDRYYDEVLSEALGELVGEGALVYDYESTHLVSTVSGSPKVYKITRRGIELLREPGSGE